MEYLLIKLIKKKLLNTLAHFTNWSRLMKYLKQMS